MPQSLSSFFQKMIQVDFSCLYVFCRASGFCVSLSISTFLNLKLELLSWQCPCFLLPQFCHLLSCLQVSNMNLIASSVNQECDAFMIFAFWRLPNLLTKLAQVLCIIHLTMLWHYFITAYCLVFLCQNICYIYHSPHHHTRTHDFNYKYRGLVQVLCVCLLLVKPLPD